MSIFQIEVSIEPDRDGFHAAVPDIPAIIVWQKTREEARAAVEDAVRGYLIMSIEHNDPIPCAVVAFGGEPSSLSSNPFRSNACMTHMAPVEFIYDGKPSSALMGSAHKQETISNRKSFAPGWLEKRKKKGRQAVVSEPG